MMAVIGLGSSVAGGREYLWMLDVEEEMRYIGEARLKWCGLGATDHG